MISSPSKTPFPQACLGPASCPEFPLIALFKIPRPLLPRLLVQRSLDPSFIGERRAELPARTAGRLHRGATNIGWAPSSIRPGLSFDQAHPENPSIHRDSHRWLPILHWVSTDHQVGGSSPSWRAKKLLSVGLARQDRQGAQFRFPSFPKRSNTFPFQTTTRRE